MASLTPRPAEGAERPLAAIGLAMLSTVAASALDATSKVLAATYHPIEVGWARFLFVQVMLLPFLIRSRARGQPLRSVNPRLQVIRSFAVLGSSLLFTAGLVRLPIAEATAISFATPLLVTGLSIPLLGEKVGPRRWTAVVVGFLGVLVIVQPGSSAFDPAAGLTLLSSVCWALSLIMTRRIRTTDAPLTTLAYSTIVPLALTSVATVAVWQTPSWHAWLLMATAAVLSLLNQYLQVLAYVRGPASLLAPFIYSQLIWSTLMGFLVFGSVPAPTTWIGAAVVMASGLYVLHRERLTRAKPRAS